MTEVPAETTDVHTRLLKCALVEEPSRIYWREVAPEDLPVDAAAAHQAYWFGDRSLAWVRVLITNLRARFDAFPEALQALHLWRHMDPRTRAQICHLHLQLTDPLYRTFTGTYLNERRAGLHPTVRRDQVIDFVADTGPGRWTMSTRIQFASRLLSCAHAVGLVSGGRDPRALPYPPVTDDALTYLLYLLRITQFEGTLLDNPYLASLGLYGEFVMPRLHRLPDVRVRMLGDTFEVEWAFASLTDWVQARHAQDAA